MDVEAVKDEQRAFYALGDYSWLAAWFMPAAEALVEASRVSPGDRVLDVAAGNGNVAVAAARRGAQVVATDLTPEMVAAGEARCRREGLAVEWRVADVEALPFADGAFDHVLSTFGAVYAPRPEVTAAEMFRVAAPGGTVGLTSWTPGGFNSQAMAAAARFLPPRDAQDVEPEAWGDKEVAERLLSPYAASVDFQLRPLERRAASVGDLWAQARRHAPAVQGLERLMGTEDFEAFGAEYRRIAQAHAGAADAGFSLVVDYALVVARARG